MRVSCVFVRGHRPSHDIDRCESVDLFSPPLVWLNEPNEVTWWVLFPSIVSFYGHVCGMFIHLAWIKVDFDSIRFWDFSFHFSFNFHLFSHYYPFDRWKVKERSCTPPSLGTCLHWAWKAPTSLAWPFKSVRSLFLLLFFSIFFSTRKKEMKK